MTFLFTALGWLKSSWIGKALAAAAAIAVGLMMVFSAGGRAQRREQKIADLEAGQDMKEIRDDVQGLSTDARRDALGRFVRPD
jgi:hypothetical protein